MGFSIRGTHQQRNKEVKDLIETTSSALKAALRNPYFSAPTPIVQSRRVKGIFNRLSSGKGGIQPQITNTSFLKADLNINPHSPVNSGPINATYLPKDWLWALGLKFANTPIDLVLKLKLHKTEDIGVHFNTDLAGILTNKEIEAALLHEDFHHRHSNIVKNGVYKILSASAINAAAIGIYVTCIEGINTFLNNGFRFWNGHNFWYAISLAFYAAIVKKFVKAKIDRNEEIKADNNAKLHVGKEAMATTLIKLTAYSSYLFEMSGITPEMQEKINKTGTLANMLEDHPTDKKRIKKLYRE